VNVTHLISLATMLLSVATILGCVLLPILAERIGRRVTLGLYYVCMLLAIGIGFGYVFYLPVDPLKWFIVCLFFLGLAGRISRCTRCGCRSSTPRSAGAARLHLLPRWGDLRERDLRF